MMNKKNSIILFLLFSCWSGPGDPAILSKYDFDNVGRLYVKNIRDHSNMLGSGSMILNSVTHNFLKYGYPINELNDNLLLGFFVVGVLYFIHSILSLSSCMKKRCLKSRCLYLYYVIFVCECLYFGSLYGSHKEYYKTIEIKVFTLSMVCFHFVYFVLLTCVKYLM